MSSAQKLAFGLFWFVCASVLGAFGPSYAVESFTVEVNSDQVTIDVQKANVKDVLVELARQADIQIKFTSEIEEQISIYISESTVAEAIVRLTPNNMIIYENQDKQQSLKELIVVAKYFDIESTGDTLSEFLPTGDPTPAVSDQGKEVSVERNPYFMVRGEVKKPGSYIYKSDLTLSEAVTLAGGLTNRASRKKITLTRMVDGRKKISRVGLAQSVKPGDLINIPEGWY